MYVCGCAYIIILFEFYIFIFVDLVKGGVLIPAGEISLHRNDDSYILLYDSYILLYAEHVETV